MFVDNSQAVVSRSVLQAGRGGFRAPANRTRSLGPASGARFEGAQ